jgi:prolipoprotein diacylglyceryltransferase
MLGFSSKSIEASIFGYLIIHPKWYHCSVIAFYLPGEYPIYVFSLLIGLGATIGLGWVSWHAADGKALWTFDLGVSSLVGSLTGGRLAYIVAHWTYFFAHPWEIPQVQLGGLAWPGVFVGWFLGVLLVCFLMKEPPWKSLEALLPLAAALMVSAWLGCWIDGYAYGFETDRWWGLPARDQWGVISYRIPVQLLGALWAILLIWFLETGRKWEKYFMRLNRAGLKVTIVYLGLSLGMLGLSFLREDPGLEWRGLRLESWAAMVLIAISLSVCIFILVFPQGTGHGEPQRERRRLEAA